jgi:hypothetical protein
MFEIFGRKFTGLFCENREVRMFEDSAVDELTLSLFGSANAYYFWAFVCAIPASIFFLIIIELGYSLFVNN